MKIRDLAFMAVRILSIYLFILGLNHLVNILEFVLPTYMQVIDYETTYTEVFFVIGIPTFILLISSVVLWFLADKLSRFIIPKSSSDSKGISLKSEEIEGFILSVIGLILFVLSFTSIARMVLNYINLMNQGIVSDRLGSIYSLVEQVIRFLLGLILLFKAEGFALMLRKIRKLGSNHLKNDETTKNEV
ncbi:hypothetical protein [Paenibacillus solani]|uniref:hypothetical protein n=1 Tax=Paenibacillus solani TaxID=1705565 RepID=UPI003D2CAFC4